MAISDYKITAEDIAKYGCVSLPDTLTGDAQENKAKFDRLVRECVANAVNAVIDHMVLVENEAQDWASAEALRVQAEAARVAAENLRVQAENDRADAETARAAAEAARVLAENLRAEAETARANAENKRDTAEKSRASAETGRVNAESARVTAESQRANAESVRAQNEAARISAEDTRIANENARKSAETDRASAETVRESGENARKSAETGRVSAETARVNAESIRQTSETARASAEKSRASAETARQSAESARNVWEAYDAARTYVPGNKVSFNGSSYVCTAATTEHAPTDTAYWLLIAQKGADGAGADDLRRINDALDAVDPTKITTKAEPADDDGVMIADSADGGKAKRLLWSNVKAALGKLFVPLARKINGKTLTEDVTLTAADIKMPDSEEDVGAAMAKRAVWDAVLVSKQSALTWAETQKEPKQCGFDPYTTDTPHEGYWCAELTLHAPSNQWRLLYVTNVLTLERWFNIYNIDHWIGWRQVSLAVAPEAHDLPLADGYTNRGCKYFRTQEGIVSFAGEIYSPSGFIADAYFATLPEGFRPDHAIIVPALLYPSRSPVSLIIETNGAVRITVTSSDTYLYVQTTFATG